VKPRRPPLPPQEVIPFLDDIAEMIAAAVLRDIGEQQQPSDRAATKVAPFQRNPKRRGQ